MNFLPHKAQALNQTGAAIIAALLIVSICAILATRMLAQAHLSLQTTAHLLTFDRQIAYAAKVKAWAIQTLYQNQGLPATKLLNFPSQTQTQTLAGILINGKLEDEQGRFNLNNLNQPSAQNQFIRLLKLRYPSLSESRAKEICHAASDWITTNPTEFDPILTRYYLQAKPSYVAAHQAMVSASELRQVAGMTAEIYQQLEDYITALPPGTSININSASLPVLMSLHPDIDSGLAQAIMAQRNGMSGFKSINDFLNLPILAKLKLNAQKLNGQNLTTNSQYFLLTTAIVHGQQQFMVYNLLHYQLQQIKVIWQSLGSH